MPFFKCKECWLEKPHSDYYKHPLTKDWIMHRCKYCVKKWRQTEHELIMARKRDIERYKNNQKRREYTQERTNRTRKQKWYWKVHTNAERWIRKLWLRPDNCPMCWNHKSMSRIEAHHYDYNKWNEIIFCCKICHSKLDRKIIDYNSCTIINVDPRKHI